MRLPKQCNLNANISLELWDFSFCHGDRSLEVGQLNRCTKALMHKRIFRKAGSREIFDAKVSNQTLAFGLAPIIHFLAQAKSQILNS